MTLEHLIEYTEYIADRKVTQQEAKEFVDAYLAYLIDSQDDDEFGIDTNTMELE